MSGGGVEFSEVSSILRQERDRSGELVKIPDDFFQKLRQHITELRRQAGVEESANPGSKKAMMLIEDVKKLSTMADHILDYRERKLVLLAQAKTDLSKKHLTAYEKEFVRGLTEVIEGHRSRLEGRHAPGEPCRGTGAGEHPSHGLTEAGPGMAILQVLEDVGEFATAERDYNLHKADVVSLPREFASVLIQQGKARELAVDG
jgi:DNA replication initiation complex subunit (GINS family)